MKEKYKLVSEYFRHKATVDEFAGAFAYQNLTYLSLFKTLIDEIMGGPKRVR